MILREKLRRMEERMSSAKRKAEVPLSECTGGEESRKVARLTNDDEDEEDTKDQRIRLVELGSDPMKEEEEARKAARLTNDDDEEEDTKDQRIRLVELGSDPMKGWTVCEEGDDDMMEKLDWSKSRDEKHIIADASEEFPEDENEHSCPSAATPLSGPRVQSRDEDMCSEDAADNNDDECYLCRDGGQLILCDMCPKAYHLHCLGIETIPEGDWKCPACCGEDGGCASSPGTSKGKRAEMRYWTPQEDAILVQWVTQNEGKKGVW
eukprot:CAMPEP_0197483228 /NCGR_PEP_ID=MMETSP1309-20131121/56778_1 /TAXON_ID=464262 /ORGANISM="Genus nov. species nov., Strain RCC998" /LENGTH=264 /DNA_ID=CAMNT_0043025821 /DNA_START=124 /DNA_END=916 /DNA_ORIENTATION=-